MEATVKSIDVFKDGAGAQKMIEIQVDGKTIGTIHLGSAGGSSANPDRVVIALEPDVCGSGYFIETIRKEGNAVGIVLEKH